MSALPGAQPNGFVYRNETLPSMTKRWTAWLGANNPCTSTPFSPAVDRSGFCTAFKRTVDFVWTEFAKKDAAQKNPCAPSSPMRRRRRSVSWRASLTMTNLTATTPIFARSAPGNPVPPPCVQEVQLNECVQALQRGAPRVRAPPPRRHQLPRAPLPPR